MQTHHRESRGSGTSCSSLLWGRTVTMVSDSLVPPYRLGALLGNGSFGVVCKARRIDLGEDDGHQQQSSDVAIKRVLQDPRYKNRELEIMRQLSHRNVVTLKDFFYTENLTAEGTQRFLNVVMEYVPETVYRVVKAYTSHGKYLPLKLVQVYMYQLLRSVGYLHSLGICHRDLKPQNLLVDVRTHVLKLCDFGSAKKLMPREASVSYICSRFYRAPELMLGSTKYTNAIDLWSCGCVLGELLLGKPLFPGDTSVDQLVKIIEILGTPSRLEMEAMNNSYMEFKFPDVEGRSWRSFFHTHRSNGSSAAAVPEGALDLLKQLLRYDPRQRLPALDALAHPFFDALREPGCLLPEGPTAERPREIIPPPQLFDFTEQEIAAVESPELREGLIPEWWRKRPPPQHY